jgi:serine/threonine-protein kinase
MSSSVSAGEPLGRLAEEFLERFRRGERPMLTEYTARHPELADEIRELFPALVMMEDVRPDPQAVPASAAGPLLRLGEYRIVREIGRGGMGVVYEAEQESLGRRVALKVLTPAVAANPKHVERFQREARTAARLHHTNIVPVFGVGEEDGIHFYVMQYIEGGPLDEVLPELRQLRGEAAGRARRRESCVRDDESSSEGVAQSLWNGRFRAAESLGPSLENDPDKRKERENTAGKPADLSQPLHKARTGPSLHIPMSAQQRSYVNSVAHVGAQAADALEYAAGQGVLHRDVKPSNLLLDVWGTVWLTDFGLAKATGAPDLTRSGDLIGTLHYMAPERFRGRVDVRSDVYALGLTLYELLALRPAFDAADQAQLIGRISSEEPPRLESLDPGLPRDLVTVVHKAIAKDPADRYQTAGALAEDLRRFLDDRSILARRPPLPEQAWRWCRRNPTMAALLAALMALLLLASGGGVWLVQQHAERRVEAARREEALRKDVNTALAQSAGFRDRLYFREARELQEQAGRRLESAGPDDLQRRLDQAQVDLDLAEQLDAAWLRAATYVEGKFDIAGAERLYAAAFAKAGLGREGDDAEVVGARVKASDVRDALVAALDDWAVCAGVSARPAWLLRVARHADPDPGGWRERARDPVTWGDGAALAELARTAPVAGPSVPLLLAVGQRLQVTGGDALGFLRRVQREHAADFWVNLALGNALKYRGSGEAIGYYRVALAVRPDAAVGYYNLGEVLRFTNWLDQAIDYYQQALRIEPGNVWAHLNRGSLLAEMCRPDEAIDHFRQATLLDPENVLAQISLGDVLRDQDRLDEALDHYRQAIKLDPNNVDSQNGFRSVLMRLERGEEVQRVWQKALEANPPEHNAWFGYAELCLFLGQNEEYRRACRAMLARFGAATDPFLAERVGRSCILLPPTEDELRKALVLIDRAVAPGHPEHDRARPYFLFAKGLAEYRQGRLGGAISLMTGDASHVMQSAPRLVLAMAQYRQGHKEAALKSLAAAVLAIDWSPARQTTGMSGSAMCFAAKPRPLSCRTCRLSFRGSTNLGTSTNGSLSWAPVSSMAFAARRSACTPTPSPPTQSWPRTYQRATATAPPAQPCSPPPARGAMRRRSMIGKGPRFADRRWTGCAPTSRIGQG